MNDLDAPTVACYCRVSSRGQRTASQRAEIERWLVGRGIDPNEVAWFEDLESGKSLRRRAFDQLQQEVASGNIRTVVVWKLDRVSRRLEDGVKLPEFGSPSSGAAIKGESQVRPNPSQSVPGNFGNGA